MIRRSLALLASLPLAIACGRPSRTAHAPTAPRAVPSLGSDGAVTGLARDVGGGRVLEGVTVVARSRQLSGYAVVITDVTGRYRLTGLPPGVYEVTFYYEDVTMVRTNITVVAGRATPVHVRIPTRQTGGEAVTM